jgi:hypothetical protein
MGERLLTLALPKPRQNAETILKTNGMFICGSVHYVTLLIQDQPRGLVVGVFYY